MKKVDFGFRCTKCNRKVSDKSLMGQNGTQIEKSGVCMVCHNKNMDKGSQWMFALSLVSGKNEYFIDFKHLRGYDISVLETK